MTGNIPGCNPSLFHGEVKDFEWPANVTGSKDISSSCALLIVGLDMLPLGKFHAREFKSKARNDWFSSQGENNFISPD